MAALPHIQNDPTLDAARAAFERRENAKDRRAYLGMSSIGRPCERQLWYSFRWAYREEFDCDTLWRFDDGFRCEDVMADRLRMVPGVQLRTIDPSTGHQFAFVDFGGHFRGHADGMISGILQAPKTLHVWEAKAVNDAKFAKLDKLNVEVGEKYALEKWDPVYYAQAVLYMAYSETTRHYLTCSTPGARSMTSVRTDTDLDAARALRAKAERIIFAAEPPPCISEDPAWYECKRCPAFELCHDQAMAAVNARTCIHATPERDGTWSCAKCGGTLSLDQQRKPCPHHLYIPALVKFAKPIDADPDANTVTYQMPDGRVFKNGNGGAPGEYTSEELRVMDRAMIGDAGADLVRQEFDARHVQPEPNPLAAPVVPWARKDAA